MDRYSPHNPSRSAFTLIELLVVIAIIAILAVVVVLTLNPAQLLAQSRDANRVSDMATLNSAIGLYITDQSGASSFSLGTASAVSPSFYDPAATGTAGTTCGTMGLPMMPSGYSWHCAASSTYRNASSTGWIPVNFQAISAGAPFGSLPTDPVNSTSSHLFYTYTTNGSQFEVTAAMESQKYQLGGGNDQISGDGAPLATVYAKGSNLTLEPLDYGDPTLVGYWALNEGSGSVAYDGSGNNATGTWSGTPTGTSGYYSPGHSQAWAGTFDGSTDSINSTSAAAWSLGGNLTVSFWIKSTTSTAYGTVAYDYGSPGFGWKVGLSALSGTIRFDIGNGTAYTDTVNSTYVLDGNWHFVVARYDGASLSIYVDNNIGGSNDPIGAGFNASGTTKFAIGWDPNLGRTWNGLIDDVRVYARALTTAQIAALYNAGK